SATQEAQSTIPSTKVWGSCRQSTEHRDQARLEGQASPGCSCQEGRETRVAEEDRECRLRRGRGGHRRAYLNNEGDPAGRRTASAVQNASPRARRSPRRLSPACPRVIAATDGQCLRRWLPAVARVRCAVTQGRRTHRGSEVRRRCCCGHPATG